MSLALSISISTHPAQATGLRTPEPSGAAFARAVGPQGGGRG
jgi:hypothetical protein